MSSNSSKVIQNKKSKFKIETVIIIILCVVAVCAALIPSSGLTLFSSSDKNNDYQNEIESKLEDVLCQINGAGKTKVLVTFSCGESVEVAKNIQTEEKNGVVKTTETVVMVSGKPYVIKTNSPKIEGVLVVCEGGEDLKVKMLITEAIVTAYDVSAEKIRIIKMK